MMNLIGSDRKAMQIFCRTVQKTHQLLSFKNCEKKVTHLSFFTTCLKIPTQLFVPR